MAFKSANKPRKSPQQDRSKVTVEAILQATARILTEEGYDKTNTNRVAEVAGVSIGSLYQYFPNKDALIAALAQQHAEEILAIVEAGWQQVENEPITVVLGSVISAIVRAHAVNPELHRVLSEQVPRIDRIRQLTDQKIAATARAYLEKNCAHLPPQNLDLTTFILCRTVESLIHSAVLDYPEMLGNGELEREIVRMLSNYLILHQKNV
jgi:AcrR family transcriptional regulator